mmetsp:Transcript_2308/g.5271  ORF Transcript_2308/g.5271 Transcript_2308/m.5271 type:complete len:110 (-) Transcript_2308:841-1170(-)
MDTLEDMLIRTGRKELDLLRFTTREEQSSGGESERKISKGFAEEAPVGTQFLEEKSRQDADGPAFSTQKGKTLFLNLIRKWSQPARRNVLHERISGQDDLSSIHKLAIT